MKRKKISYSKEPPWTPKERALIDAAMAKRKGSHKRAVDKGR